MSVNIYEVDKTAHRHLLREELIQSLGFSSDSYLYPDSIFQQKWTSTTFYSALDEELIHLLYHPKMKPGFVSSQVEYILLEIFESEQG